MANTIKLGYSNSSGQTPNTLAGGELATNTSNRKIWVGNGSGNTLVFNHADYAPASANASQSWVSSNFSNNAGDITGVTAGTGMSGGGSSGTVTLNCTITDTNTWRALGTTSDKALRGDHAQTAYTHSQAAHAPSNANYITNNNQLTNGASYVTASVVSGYATTAYVLNQIDNLVDSAPGALNTLNELAAALGDDASYASTITSALAGKYSTSNPSGYTTNVGDITGVTAGTGMSGGGSSGTVTLNCTITDTNTWRGLGGTSSTGHRGDHGVTAYNHSQAAHAPSNANYITNNNQLTNGAGYLPKAGGTMTGDFSTNQNIISTSRNKGVMGIYDSYKTDQIWSMGAAYVNHASGTNFGNLYGLAYKHTNNSTGGTMANGHQMVWCDNGTAKCALGNNIWTSGTVTWSGGSSGNANTAYTHSQAAHAPSNANYITNNNQLTNGSGYTTNVGDITGVTAGTGMSGGGSSGTVTLNCTITDTNTWRGLGGTSSVGHRGDHGVTAYNHSQAAHAPSNANYITNNNQLSNGAGYTNNTVANAALPKAGGSMTGNIEFGSSNGKINLSRGSFITFYEGGDSHHSIGSRNTSGSEADDLRFNSYNDIHVNLDSNGNNSNSYFRVGQHGAATGSIANVAFTVRGDGYTTWSGGNSNNANTAYTHSQAAHAPSNANYITNNNQLTNGAGYTTAVGDITNVIAGTGMSGGGSSGSVTLNCSITDTNTWRGLGSTSSTGHRGDHGVTAYNHSQAAHAPSNANYITNNNQLSNGAGYITSYTNTTYTAGTGMTLSGTTFNCSITDTNTWRAIGSTSSTSMRGDHGTTAYNHSQAAHAPSNANYITNNNQLTNGAGYTTAVGDITGVTAGTACTGGGTSGAVTINVSLGNSSTTCGRGDWAAYGYDHATGFAPNGYRHIPSNGSSGQFLGWSSTGNAQWVSNPNSNTTYTASTGLYLSGTDIRHSDTSSQGSSNNSGTTFIQDITLDGYGHVTAIGTATASGGGGGTTWNGMENISTLSALP